MREGVELAAEDGDGLGVHRFVGGVDEAIEHRLVVAAAAQQLVVAAAAGGAQPARAIARREAALRAVARVAKIAELGAQRRRPRAEDGVEEADRRVPLLGEPDEGMEDGLTMMGEPVEDSSNMMAKSLPMFALIVGAVIGLNAMINVW